MRRKEGSSDSSSSSSNGKGKAGGSQMGLTPGTMTLLNLELALVFYMSQWAGFSSAPAMELSGSCVPVRACCLGATRTHTSLLNRAQLYELAGYPCCPVHGCTTGMCTSQLTVLPTQGRTVHTMTTKTSGQQASPKLIIC